MNYFENKTAIVTGASSGIGKEISRKLLEKGSNVVAVARREDKLQELKEESIHLLGECIPLTVDISNLASISELMEELEALNLKINILVNNAGVGVSKEFITMTQDDINTVLGTNLSGTVNLTHSVLTSDDLYDSLEHIIFVTSLAGKMGFPNLSTYSATKFALEGFADSLRQELSDRNLTVTIFRPGVTDTEFFNVAHMEGFAEAMKEQGKIYSPEKVADEFVKKILQKPNEVTVGPDKWFLKLLPFLPNEIRFKILSLFS